MLPIALRPDGRRAVIVGGGNVAARKADTLVAAGFPIFVVAPEIDARLRALVEERGGKLAERPYRAGDLDGAVLAIAATNDSAVNASVVEQARRAGVLVCDTGDPDRGDFAMPATLRAGGLTISVESGGASPAFSKRVAAELERAIDPAYGRAAATLAAMRAYVKAAVSGEERAAVLRALAALPVEELAAMNAVEAEHEVDEAVSRLRDRHPLTGSAICASRTSALAMVQTRAVAARLAQRGIATEILGVTTTGDRVLDRAIDQLGSINVFVKELETALRERRADYAVHSCKDLPSELVAGLRIVAISAREDARDAFCSEKYPSFDALPPGAIVGTSSPRRRMQLQAMRSDLRYEDLRGNVDTRLRKLAEGRYDAIVLAMAGLNRLGARASITLPFETDVLVPAVAQGALAIEMRAGEDPLALALREAINDERTERCVLFERAALRALRAGCSAPIGIHARLSGDGKTLIAAGAYATPGGMRRSDLERAVSSTEEAEAAGRDFAALLAPPAGPFVVLPRTQERPSRIAEALRAGGVEVVELLAGDDGPDPAERIPDMVVFPSSGSVSAASRYLARLRQRQARPRVVAMGPQSRDAAQRAGFAPDAVAAEASIEAFVALIRDVLRLAP